MTAPQTREVLATGKTTTETDASIQTFMLLITDVLDDAFRDLNAEGDEPLTHFMLFVVGDEGLHMGSNAPDKVKLLRAINAITEMMLKDSVVEVPVS